MARLLARAGQHLQAGRQALAIVPLQEAARWRPADAAILHDLGLACLECGRLEEAVASLRAAIAAAPGFADAHLRLGVALEAAGETGPALEAYGAALAVLPSLADAGYRAASLLERLGRGREAARAFRAAAVVAPHTTPGRIATARALLLEDRDDEAMKVLRQTLALDRDHAVALDLLGHALADAGRFDEARPVLERAIAQAPHLAGSYYDVARCGRMGPGDAGLVARMRAAAAMPGLEPATRSRVHLALGKAAHDQEDFAAAMQHYDAAEACRNAVTRFDLAAFEALIDRTIACFTPEVFARASPAGAGGSPAPILILGLPRSGTTLVEQIVSAHPDVHAGGELPFWNERAGGWDNMPSQAFLDTAAGDYRRLLRDIGGKAEFVTDKMPQNILWAGLIHLALPAATIIHCSRSPIDTALSIHQTHFSPLMAMPTGGAALVGYVRATRRLAAHWRRVLPRERFVDVGYEALARAPDVAIRRLVGACGLAWDAACLRPDRNARAIKTPSQWQARQPIYQDAVGRWRLYEPWLGALAALGEDEEAVLF